MSRALDGPARAASSDPSTAASANKETGNPVSMPISVAESWRSSLINVITGGTARTVSRNPTPASQRDAIAMCFCVDRIGSCAPPSPAGAPPATGAARRALSGQRQSPRKADPGADLGKCTTPAHLGTAQGPQLHLLFSQPRGNGAHHRRRQAVQRQRIQITERRLWQRRRQRRQATNEISALSEATSTRTPASHAARCAAASMRAGQLRSEITDCSRGRRRRNPRH